jgi:predicted methyltransferase
MRSLSLPSFLAISLVFLACASAPHAPAWTNTEAAVAAALAQPGRDAKDLERDARDHPATTLGLVGLAPGMRVLDLFSGGGYYAELAARVVGATGHVTAYNNRAYLSFDGKALDARLAARPFPQLARLDAEIESVDLGGRVDVALVVMAYHDAYWVPAPKEGQEPWTVTRDPLMTALWRSLRPGGRVLVVDHAALAGTGNTAAGTLHRIDEAFARADFERAGFRFVASSDALRNPADPHTANVFKPEIRGHTDRFVLVFEKPALADAARHD